VPGEHDPELAAAKITPLSTAFPVQYGQSLVVRVTQPGAGGGLATLAKDVVRWKGKSGSDIQPMRVYLGPWQPQPNIASPGGPAVFYQKPTPWQTPEPLQFDFFREGQIYARINFGAGGVQHQAFVDWPPRGLLFQVSAQYIQVDGVGTLTTPPGFDDPNLPILLAHVAPEPGGGDAVQPATFTYPPIDFFAPPLGTAIIFQVPPFARLFTPVLNRETMIATALPGVIIRENGPPVGNTWVFDATVPNDFPNDRAFPLSGFAKQLIFQATDAGGVFVDTINMGCMFLLDL